MGGVAETREALSFEGASFIGPSHSLTGARSTTVFKFGLAEEEPDGPKLRPLKRLGNLAP